MAQNRQVAGVVKMASRGPLSEEEMLAVLSKGEILKALLTATEAIQDLSQRIATKRCDP